ncbi:hypothetical protein AURDEDRAFT_177762 [Auricularia subglabra TFB-10046 SS5]|uniref:Uncharacterized protein n=1 Tax=Auricularia subglabra (strain TFB-10046 / SS5) TaxID=717982 RepID=J0D3A7_AURST|nr:hypothetical protein AURDEDRAFT_177762 [Auricularia subglabra TFB-10046 SS5]
MLYPALADHLARTSLAATSSSSRSSATVLVSSVEALPGAGTPTISPVRPSPRHPAPRACPRWYWYRRAMLYPALADHLARTSLSATSSSSRVSAMVLVSSGEDLPGRGTYVANSILDVALSVTQADRLARANLAATSSSSRTSATTDYHFEQMLLGLMDARPRGRFMQCALCGIKTRHTVGFCKDPTKKDVGRWLSKCVLCPAPLKCITPTLPRSHLDIIKAYHDRRQEIIVSSADSTQRPCGGGDYDVDLPISAQLYESSNTAVPIEFSTANFPFVSMWDSPSIKRKYENDVEARFEVYNPLNDDWQLVTGDQHFDFVPFTPVVARLYGVPDGLFVDASVQAAKRYFNNAITPHPDAVAETSSAQRNRRAESPSSQIWTRRAPAADPGLGPSDSPCGSMPILPRRSG